MHFLFTSPKSKNIVSPITCSVGFRLQLSFELVLCCFVFGLLVCNGLYVMIVCIRFRYICWLVKGRAQFSVHLRSKSICLQKKALKFQVNYNRIIFALLGLYEAARPMNICQTQGRDRNRTIYTNNSMSWETVFPTGLKQSVGARSPTNISTHYFIIKFVGSFFFVFSHFERRRQRDNNQSTTNQLINNSIGLGKRGQNYMKMLMCVNVKTDENKMLELSCSFN